MVFSCLCCPCLSRDKLYDIKAKVNRLTLFFLSISLHSKSYDSILKNVVDFEKIICMPCLLSKPNNFHSYIPFFYNFSTLSDIPSYSFKRNTLHIHMCIYIHIFYHIGLQYLQYLGRRDTNSMVECSLDSVIILWRRCTVASSKNQQNEAHSSD